MKNKKRKTKRKPKKILSCQKISKKKKFPPSAKKSLQKENTNIYIKNNLKR